MRLTDKQVIELIKFYEKRVGWGEVLPDHDLTTERLTLVALRDYLKIKGK